MKISHAIIAILPLLAFAAGLGARGSGGAISHQSSASKMAVTPFAMYTDVLAILKRDYYGQEIDTTQMAYSGIRGMMGSLNDHYTRFLDPVAYKAAVDDSQGGFVGIGALFKINKEDRATVVHVLPNSPAHHASVMAGDIIVKIDGRNALTMKGEEVTNLLLGAPDTKVKLSLRRKNVRRPVMVTIVRRVVPQEIVHFGMLDETNKIGYVSLMAFNDESDRQVQHALTQLKRRGLRGLVFDLRGNPGGLVNIAQRVASRFVPAGPIVWVKDTSGVLKAKYAIPSLYDRHAKYPLVVLINGKSASAAEIVSGAIKDTHSGVLIGEKTFGKGIVQSIFGLDDGSAAVITTDHYFTPKHHDIHHKGIEPDIAVALTDDDQRRMQGFTQEHPEAFFDLKYDRQLQRAVAELRGILPSTWVH